MLIAHLLTPWGAFWSILAVLFLMIATILVIAKYSFIRLRREYVQELAAEEEEPKWSRISNFYDSPNRYLGTIQWVLLVVTLLYYYSIYQCWMLLTPPTIQWLWGEWILSLVVLLVAVTLFWIVADLIPKAVALQNALKWLPRTAGIVRILHQICAPIIWLGERLATMYLHTHDLTLTNEVEMPRTEAEIRLLFNEGHLSGQLDEREGELIKNAFTFVDRLAREVMIPRPDMSVLYYEDSLETMREAIRTSRHTRYPLCDGDKDHIIGLIHVKNFMELYITGKPQLKQIISEILIIPEVMPIFDLLQLMRTRRIYLAAVVDEFGGTVGLVGLEDIIEELVGDIQDEHEPESLAAILELDEDRFEFDGNVILEDVEKLLDVDFAEVEADTIGGYVFALLERIPRNGDHIVIDGWDFCVTKVNGFRIVRLLVTRVLNEEPDVDDEHE